MKKAISIFVILALIASLAVVTVNAQRPRRESERYAVGGEILPFSVSSFLLTPWVLALAALLILAAGGAIYTGAIKVDITRT